MEIVGGVLLNGVQKVKRVLHIAGGKLMEVFPKQLRVFLDIVAGELLEEVSEAKGLLLEAALVDVVLESNLLQTMVRQFVIYLEKDLVQGSCKQRKLFWTFFFWKRMKSF